MNNNIDQTEHVKNNTKQNPKVVNVKTAELKKLGYNSLQEWLKDSNHIYVGRDMTWAVKGAVGSKWHNPFKVNEYGVDGCLKKFEEYIMNNKELLYDIHELRDKDLGCWCVPYHGCHAEVLLKLANEIKKPKVEQPTLMTTENFPALSSDNNTNIQKIKSISYKDKLTNK